MLINWILSNEEFNNTYIHPMAAYMLKSLLDEAKTWKFLSLTNRLLIWLLMKYEGTVTIKDRCLLGTMWTLEKKGFSIVRFMTAWHLCHWTDWEAQLEDLNHAEQDIDNRINASIEAVDNSMMWKTIESFPVHSSFLGELSIAGDQESSEDGSIHTYDPQFFLPLLYFISKHTRRLNLRKMFEVNLVGLAIIALTSEDVATRHLGSSILYHIYYHLEQDGHDLRGQSQLLHFLYSFKNTITLIEDQGKIPENYFRPDRMTSPYVTQMPFVFCLFTAKSITILLRPEHPLYAKINEFVLQRALIDPHDIPLFYRLFHSTEANTYQTNRHFLLTLLSPGVKTLKDFQIFQRRHVLELLCTLYQSSVVEYESLRRIILQVRQQWTGQTSPTILRTTPNVTM